MKIRKATILTACLGIGLVRPLCAAEAAKADCWGVTVPDYLSEASLTAKLGYDSNVYATDNSLPGKPDLANQESAVFSVSPKLLFNGLKLFELPKDSAVQAFSFGYSGDYVFFGSFSGENNGRHTLPFALKLKQEAWSFSLDNSFLWVQGPDDSPLYNLYSAYGTATVRERRSQIQNRFSASLRFDEGACFVRAAAAALSYNLLTDLHNSATEPAYKGYQNWVDRSDIGVGLDFGYKASKDLSFIAGWRTGKQSQSRYTWGGNHCDSTFNRLQFGFEGKLASWLQGSLLAGPDFRSYSDTAFLGITGTSHTWLYLDGSLNATASADDRVTLTGKVWHWVSSTGTTSYQDSSYALTWKHSFSKQLSTSVGIKFQASNYDAPAVRHDQFFSYPVGLTYSVSKEIVLGADYQYGKAHNRISGTLGREYTQNQFTLTLRLAL